MEMIQKVAFKNERNSDYAVSVLDPTPGNGSLEILLQRGLSGGPH